MKLRPPDLARVLKRLRQSGESVTLMPFELVVRQTLCIVCFAPLSSLAPIYTDRCHGNTELASFTNSMSIAVSLVIMLTLGLTFVLH